MLTVVGEIAAQRAADLPRQAHPPAGVPPRDGAADRRAPAEDDVLRQEPGHGGWQARRLAKGRRGVFVGQVSTVPRRVAAHQPADGAVRGRDASEEDEDGGIVDSFGDLYPIYPQTKGVESWDIQRAVNFARSVIDEVPELVPDDVRDEYDVVDARTAVDLIHAPDTFAQVERGPAPLPLRGGAGHPGRARPATGLPARARARRPAPAAAACWRRSTSGCRSR